MAEDNIGQYLTYGQLLLEMYLASNSKVTATDIVLTNKTVDAGGDTYEYVLAAGTLNIGDVLTQAGETDCIVELLLAPLRIRVEKTGVDNPIVNGPAKFLHAETIPKKKANQIIQGAMDLIDESTGSFFNKREGTWEFEGRNTPLMHLSVPIIQIDKLLINSTDCELEEGEDFHAFKSRSNPRDDRKNPRIKLNIGKNPSSIYSGSVTSRAFLKGALTSITGAFGYLEEDGSTPLLIQRATAILTMKDINTPIGSSVSATDGSGPLKRLKVDLHEQEFFEASSNKESVKSTASGDAEVDRIMALFRTPIRVGGSFTHVSTGVL